MSTQVAVDRRSLLSFFSVNLSNFLRSTGQYFYYVTMMSLPVSVIVREAKNEKTKRDSKDGEDIPVVTDGTTVYMIVEPDFIPSTYDTYRYVAGYIHIVNTILLGSPFAVDAAIEKADTPLKKNLAFLLGNIVSIAKAAKLDIENELYDTNKANMFVEAIDKIVTSFLHVTDVKFEGKGVTPPKTAREVIELVEGVLGLDVSRRLDSLINDAMYYATVRKELEIKARIRGKEIDLNNILIWEVATGDSPVEVTITNTRTGKQMKTTVWFPVVKVNIAGNPAPSSVNNAPKLTAMYAVAVNNGSSNIKRALKQNNQKALIEAVKKALKEAVEAAKRFVGAKLPGVGRIEGEIYEFNLYDTEDDWLRYIKGLIQIGLTGPKVLPSWRKINRRNPEIKPGFYPARKPTLIFLMDVSGSMYSDKNLDKVMSELINIGLKWNAEILWIQWSDGPSPPKILRRGQIRMLKNKKKVAIDTGGTQIKEALRLALEKLSTAKHRRSVVLIMSDGYIGDTSDPETIELLKKVIDRSSLTIFATVEVVPPEFEEITHPKFKITEVKVRGSREGQ